MFIPGQIVDNWNISHAGKLQRRLLRELYSHAGILDLELPLLLDSDGESERLYIEGF